MDTSQSAALRPLLLDTGVTGGFAQHSMLCNENNCDLTVREPLLELLGQSLLDLVEGFQLRNRDEDINSLLLPRTSTSQAAEICRM